MTQITLTNRLAGKNVFITGASSGIGQACALEFARYGANVILAARRADRLEKLEAEILANYPQSKVFTVVMDVTHPTQTEVGLNQIVAEYPQIDILVNNAGLSAGLNEFVDDDPENWEVMIDTNIKGFLQVLQFIAKLMKAQGHGHIINIGSVAGVEAYAKGHVYCATKHAVHAITQSLREEMVGYGVKISEILPGMVNTEFSQVRFKGDMDKANAVYAGLTPLTPRDLAEIITYNANLPAHVNVAESLIFPLAQSRATKSHRN